jgi:hypothetical protein
MHLNFFLLWVQTPSATFLFFLFLTLAGTLISGSILRMLASLIRQKDERGMQKAHPELTGEKINAIALTWKIKTQAFEDTLNSMHPKSIVLLKNWLRFDYVFMLFLYPFLFLLCLGVSKYSTVDKNWYHGLLDTAKWLAIAIGILDMLENYFALRSIKKTTAGNVVFMSLFSTSKWTAAIAYTALFVIAIGYAIASNV